RLELMLRDSGASVLVSERGLVERLPWGGARALVLDDLLSGEEPPSGWACRVEPENLAYLIYTSGSTGMPKAVGLSHGNAVSLVGWASGAFTPLELSGVLASTSIGFDLSVFELFVPLCLGGTVVLADDALSLLELAARGEVTLVNTVPSAMAELVGWGSLPGSLRTVNLAGGRLTRGLADAGQGPA